MLTRGGLPSLGHSSGGASLGRHVGIYWGRNTAVQGCSHTTCAPLLSASWEARLEEILRGAQRDHPVPAEGD